MPTLFMTKRNGVLEPNSKAAQIEFDRLPAGPPLRVKAVRARNGGFHRLSWCFFTYVASALNEGPTPAVWTPEDVKDHLLVATGYCREIKAHGKVGFIPKHTNFDAMDQGDYAKFMDAAMIYVRDDLCKWIEDSPDWPHIQAILKESYLLGDDE